MRDAQSRFAPTVVERARAKVNLALHVVGRRADGYHLLDTLVAFPDVADIVSVRVAERHALVLSGPGAADLAADPPETNLVLRAARGFGEILGLQAGFHVTLEKHLPVAAGLGGGSADAAATLRALGRLTGHPMNDPSVGALAASLGADVPMCLVGLPARATGIGEVVEPLGDGLPPFGIVLANPRRPVSTPAVFRALERRDNAPPAAPPAGSDPARLLEWLAETRNDLEAPAITVEPAVADVLEVLRAAPATLFARMSGSGATCFALTPDAAAAAALAAALSAHRPGWWIASAALA